MIRVLFVGGGSLGHLTPSLAVWEAIKKKESKAKCLFVCSSRLQDRKFLSINKIRKTPIYVPKISNLLGIILFPIFFPLACAHSLVIILLFRPHVIFSKGGYVSVPVCIVGWLLMRPIVLHESDRVMGKANRSLIRFAKHLCIGTPQKELADKDIMARTDVIITATGNPIRERLLTGSKDGGRRVTGFSGKRPAVLVIGGSQGAQILNEAVWQDLEKLIDLCDVLHLTGSGKMKREVSHAHYWQKESVYEDLENIYAFADIVISRAGAGAIAELSALGKASILVPLPEKVQKHQKENAHFLETAGSAIVLDQKSLAETLVPTVRSLIDDENKRISLGNRMKSISDPNSADRIANILLETAR